MNQNNEKSNLKAFVIVAAFLAIFGSLIYSSRNVETLDTTAAKPTYKKTIAQVDEQTIKDDVVHESPFKKLAESKTAVQAPAVLQAATEDDGGTLISGTDGEGATPGNSLASGYGGQSSPSVPSTGSTTITMALILSSAALAFGFFILAKNPRKVALTRFEKKITKRL